MTAAEVGGLSGTRYMTVVANGPLAKAAGGGFRGYVQGANGVASHATLDDPALLASIANPAAIWQIASIVVAQKHLADINEKLDKIKAGIDNINFHLKEDRRSIATGAIRYFSQITNSILAGELSNSVRSQIEAHECALLKMQEQVLADIQRQVDNIRHVKLPFAFGSDSSRQAIRECQEELDETYAQFLLCLKARACGWQLLLAFPGEDTLKESRRRDIGDALVSLDEGSEMLRQTDEFMQQKIRELSSMWNTKLTVNERKMELREWGPKLKSDIEVTRERILEEIRIADMAMIDLQGVVTFVAKVEDGRVVAISPGK